jgi:sialidase-1
MRHITAVLLTAFFLGCTASEPPVSEPESQEGAGSPVETALFKVGEGGYFLYRIPALAVSTKGTLLAFAEARKNDGHDWDDTDIVLRRSFDSGQTWEDMQVVVDDGKHTIGNECPVVDHQTGTILLPFCKNNRQVFVTKSTDDGETWSEPVEITDDVKDPVWSFVGAGPGHGIQLKSGRLLIPAWGDETPGPVELAEGAEGQLKDVIEMVYSLMRPVIWRQWRPQNVQFSYAFFSDDHGATWKRGQILTKDRSDECEAVETVDGTVYMTLRSRSGKQRWPSSQVIDQGHRRGYARSKDGGETWSEVQYDETLPEPGCQGSVVRFTDQESFNKNRILVSNPASTTERSQMTVRLSYDEGKTWPVSKVVYQGSAGYSNLAIAPDMSILCIYTKDLVWASDAGYPGPDAKVSVARFDLEWLTDGADSLQKKVP